MKKSLLILALATAIGQLSAQKSPSWTKVAPTRAAGLERIREVNPSEEQNLYQVNTTLLKQTLQGVGNRWSGGESAEILMPNMNGAMERFQVWENSNFEPELQAQYPDIRAYVGKGITDPAAVLNFSLSSKGIQTMVTRGDRTTEFIEPFTKDRSVYVIFDSKTYRPGRLPFVCSTEDVAVSEELGRSNAVALASNGSFKTMRLALSCNGEYATFHGGTVEGALDAMNATMTRCNGVFEKDLAIHLNIIANNSAVIFLDPATDPYSNNLNQWNTQLQNTLTANIGEANYDIGHMFGASGGGGNAGCIGCVCVNGTKGRGITSPADGIPQGDTFDIDYVVHEMGHQMGANHTFSMDVEGYGVNVEPGSGSTIMGYAGITGATDVQQHSDDYFTYRSILQIQTNMATKSCPVSVAMSNTAPVVNAGADYTIPKGTAYKLTGTGTDTAGENLTFAWEQNDSATGTNDTGNSSFAFPTKTTGPNFRSIAPNPSPVRYMPAFPSVLAGTLSTTWESVNSVARTLNFTLTAWDNVAGGGQTNTDAMVVTVNATAGPFAVTAPTLNQSWIQGETQAVTWNVAGTASAPINTSNVNILFSSDAGATWTTLVANTPNDGTETITVPNVQAASCYILVEAVGNIYYAVSRSFAIGYTITTTCNTYSNATALPIPDGLDANVPGATATSTITVPALEGTIADVNVGLNVTHTYPNDLVISIKHPDNTASAVWNRACAGNNNFNVTLNDGSPAFTCVTNMTGTFAPSSPLSVFNGKPASGLWTLSVNDFYDEDTGTLNSWSLEICTQVAQLAAPSFGLADFAIYPNPNSGNFSVRFTPSGEKEVSISVHDLRGRQVFGDSYANSGAFAQNVQLNQVQAGVYLVTVQQGDRREVRKIVVN